MMPTMGNLTLVVVALSYAGQLNLTAVADRDACPDVEVFAQGVRSALDDLSRAGGVDSVATCAAREGEARSAQERRSNVGSARS